MGKKMKNAAADKDKIFLSREQKTVSKYLSKLKFSSKLIGGVDEADVWKKIEKLCELYEMALDVERAKVEELEAQLYSEKKVGKEKTEQSRVWDELFRNMEAAERQQPSEDPEAEEL